MWLLITFYYYMSSERSFQSQFLQLKTMPYRLWIIIIVCTWSYFLIIIFLFHSPKYVIIRGFVQISENECIPDNYWYRRGCLDPSIRSLWCCPVWCRLSSRATVPFSRCTSAMCHSHVRFFNVIMSVNAAKCQASWKKSKADGPPLVWAVFGQAIPSLGCYLVSLELAWAMLVEPRNLRPIETCIFLLLSYYLLKLLLVLIVLYLFSLQGRPYRSH